MRGKHLHLVLGILLLIDTLYVPEAVCMKTRGKILRLRSVTEHQNYLRHRIWARRLWIAALDCSMECLTYAIPAAVLCRSTVVLATLNDVIAKTDCFDACTSSRPCPRIKSAQNYFYQRQSYVTRDVQDLTEGLQETAHLQQLKISCKFGSETKILHYEEDLRHRARFARNVRHDEKSRQVHEPNPDQIKISTCREQMRQENLKRPDENSQHAEFNGTECQH